MNIQEQAQEIIDAMANYETTQKIPMRSANMLFRLANGLIEGDMMLVTNSGTNSWPETIVAVDGSFESKDNVFDCLKMFKESGCTVLSYRFQGEETILETVDKEANYFTSKKI